MSNELDLDELVKIAREKRVLTFHDLKGYRLNLQQIKDLQEKLSRFGIETSDKETGSVGSLSQEAAEQIITSLRSGVPPPNVDVTTYSVGCINLIQQFHDDLDKVNTGSSLVRFMNADWGSGKTHSLYLLRENAFRLGFVVSIVQLSQTICPLHDFMSVYDSILWNLRTNEQREKPALENVLDRWLHEVSVIGKDRVKRIIEFLPHHLVLALQAYYESVGPIRRDEEKRMLVLNYLSGKTVPVKDLRRLGIQNRVVRENALDMLTNMCRLFKNLKYSGICILFDETESIHSFSSSNQRDSAFNNLSHLVSRSSKLQNCYFLYATTPTFFSYSGGYQIGSYINSSSIFELEKLTVFEKKRLASRICQIYEISREIEVPKRHSQILDSAAEISDSTESTGDFVRKCITVLDNIP